MLKWSWLCCYIAWKIKQEISSDKRQNILNWVSTIVIIWCHSISCSYYVIAVYIIPSLLPLGKHEKPTKRATSTLPSLSTFFSDTWNQKTVDSKELFFLKKTPLSSESSKVAKQLVSHWRLNYHDLFQCVCVSSTFSLCLKKTASCNFFHDDMTQR